MVVGRVFWGEMAVWGIRLAGSWWRGEVEPIWTFFYARVIERKNRLWMMTWLTWLSTSGDEEFVSWWTIAKLNQPVKSEVIQTREEPERFQDCWGNVCIKHKTESSECMLHQAIELHKFALFAWLNSETVVAWNVIQSYIGNLETRWTVSNDESSITSIMSTWKLLDIRERWNVERTVTKFWFEFLSSQDFLLVWQESQQ